jgi:hypothetical protein
MISINRFLATDSTLQILRIESSFHSRALATNFFLSPLMRVRNLLPSNGRCIQSHYLATGLHATLLKIPRDMACLCVYITMTEKKHICLIVCVWMLWTFPPLWCTMFGTRGFIYLVATLSFWVLSAEDKTVFELRQILVRGHANRNPEIQRWRNIEWVVARERAEKIVIIFMNMHWRWRVISFGIQHRVVRLSQSTFQKNMSPSSRSKNKLSKKQT